jgi:hypothetical protein
MASKKSSSQDRDVNYIYNHWIIDPDCKLFTIHRREISQTWEYIPLGYVGKVNTSSGVMAQAGPGKGSKMPAVHLGVFKSKKALQRPDATPKATFTMFAHNFVKKTKHVKAMESLTAAWSRVNNLCRNFPGATS